MVGFLILQFSPSDICANIYRRNVFHKEFNAMFFAKKIGSLAKLSHTTDFNIVLET